jgi:phage terminase large subunit-like protein
VDREAAQALLDRVAGLPAETLRRVLGGLPEAAVRGIVEEWWWGARGGQNEPAGDWRVWTILAGRGFGKTRVGAEWVSQRARDVPGARIALVAASLEEVARVMVEGESGLLAVARSGEKVRWQPSRGVVTFESGAVAFAYSAEKPGMLRGPQHHFGWCDELAKWPASGADGGRAPSTGSGRGRAAWDNLMLGMRLGQAPRTIVTTTPRPLALLDHIEGLRRSVRTRGRTADNPFSAADFREAVEEMYGGTRLGRQELEGEIVREAEGALWTREMLEAARAARPEALARVVIGVDPPAGTGGTCGIVAYGLGADGAAYVLGDHSVAGMRPEGWARRVAAAAEAWEASRVIAEKNQGGDMVESVLRAVESELPVKLVSATRGKGARAEPVALRFETGKARLAGSFPKLEDELAGLTPSGFEGAGASPDRADAMVWAMSELFEKGCAEPRVRRL